MVSFNSKRHDSRMLDLGLLKKIYRESKDLSEYAKIALRAMPTIGARHTINNFLRQKIRSPLRLTMLERRSEIYEDYIKYKWKNGEVLLGYRSKGQIRKNSWLFNEVFLKECYGNLNVFSRDVVDIGANIGDTAIYFASKGAKKVYAFEPYPYSYNLAILNMELNDIREQVALFRAGVGSEGKIRIEENFENGKGEGLVHFNSGVEIPVLQLSMIVKERNLRDAVLKIDCEGGEYDIILPSSRETIRTFVEIQIEYHFGYELIERKLADCGFMVSHTRSRLIPAKTLNIELPDRIWNVGQIYAKRNPEKNNSVV